MDTDRLKSAIQARDSGDPRRALIILRELKQSLTSPEQLVALLLNEVACLTLLKKYDEARARLGEAASRDRDLQTAALDIAYAEACIYSAEERHSEEITKIDEIFATFSDALKNTEYFNFGLDLRIRRACALVCLGRHREAILDLSRCLSEALDDDQEQQVRFFLGDSLAATGRRTEAEEEFRKVLLTGTDEGLLLRAHYMLGLFHVESEEYTEAQPHLEHCAARLPHPALPEQAVYSMLAQVYQNLGNWEQHKKYLALASGSRLIT